MQFDRDAIEMMLEDVGEARQREARRITTFLRLLIRDGEPSGAERVHVDVVRARRELELGERRHLLAALEELAAAHLTQAAGAESFLPCALEHGAPAEAWRVLEGLRGSVEGLAELAGPGESALSVARRVVDSLQRLSLEGDGRRALWQLRLRWVVEGPRAVEAELERRAREAIGTLRCELSADLAAVWLDRGAVARAHDWLEREEAAGVRSRRANQFLVWTHLLRGELERARARVEAASPWRAHLPHALAQLRASFPKSNLCLSGTPCAGPAAAPWAREARTDLGASLLVVFRFEEGVASAVHVDCAPGLRQAADRWLEDHSEAASLSGTSEHELVLRVACVRELRADTPLRGVLNPDARAVLLVPIRDALDEVAGWVYLESEHYLLPTDERAMRLAAAWRRSVLAPATTPIEDEEFDGTSRRRYASFFEGFTTRLAIKTSQRRWWGFVLEDGHLRCVAGGGEGLRDVPPGAGQALVRAQRVGGRVLFEGPDARLAQSAGAASGVVIPLRPQRPQRSTGAREAGVIGYWVLESARRRDFKASDLERYQRTAEAHAVGLAHARFAAWHEERFGVDVTLESRDAEMQALFSRLESFSVARTFVALSGEAGSGKNVLARWLHHAGSGPQSPIRRVTRDLEDELTREGEGTLVVDELDHLDADEQRGLLEALDGAAKNRNRPRLVILSRHRPNDLVGLGALRDDLAARLDRAHLRVPALRERRVDLGDLIDFTLCRIAEEESLAPAELDDSARALLWRQPWPGNLRELEAVLYPVALHQAGHEVCGADLDELARSWGRDLLRRLPSRQPRREELEAAIESTRKATGRANKTRAALYLGWDPDTLVARLKDMRLDVE